MVTVCKFFLTNSCRYGDRCRYSHTLPNENYRSNPYVYDARKKNDGVSIMQRYSSPQNVSHHQQDDIDKLFPEYVKKMSEDINQIEQQHMWPLTCYSFSKSHGNLPGWNDISMEEIRWEAYQAQANNTMHIYLAKVQELLNNAKELRSVFIRPSKQYENQIREYLKGNNSMAVTANQNTPFLMNTQPQQSPSSFSFASAFEKTDPTLFGQLTSTPTNSVFFSQNVQANLFNQTQPIQQPHPPAQSFFGNKSTFTTSPETSSTNFFGNASFIQETSNSMEIGTNIFGTPFSNNQTSFGADQQNAMHFSSGFGSNSAPSASVNNDTVYSRTSSLSKDDFEAFKANTFTLENLPFNPPPKELCH